MQHVFHCVVTQTKSFFRFSERFCHMWWTLLSSRDVHQTKKMREK
jgi:hypothetical protein